MDELHFEELTSQHVERGNAFFGFRRIMKFSVAKEVWFKFIPEVPLGKNFALLALEVQKQPFRIYLSQLPKLSDLHPKLQNINWSILPLKLQLLFWEASLAPLWTSLEAFLGSKIKLVSLEEYAPKPGSSLESIGFHAFVPALQQSFFGYLQTSDAIFNSLAKHWKRLTTPPIRLYQDIWVNYSLEIGYTELAQEDYENIREEDLILLDYESLSSGNVSPIHGLEPLKINVVPCNEGFKIQKIQF